MNFLEALRDLKKGKKVRRKSWNENEKMWLLEGYLLHTHPFWDGQTKMIDSYFYIPLLGDLEAEDWEIIKE